MFSFLKQPPGFYRQVALLSAPIVLQNLITSTLGMADTFMVGMLGEAPMAAVTLANIPLFAVQMFIFGVQSGSSVLMSQYWGRQDLTAINRVMGVGMWSAGAVSALFAAVLLLWPVEFLSLFNNQPQVIALAARYGRIAGCSYVFEALVMVYISAYRSMERPKIGMYILVVSMLVNTFLNWVLIFGRLGAPALGVEGAAWATLTARVLELLIVIVHALRTRGFRLRPAILLRPGLDMAGRFLRCGGPVVFNEFTWGVGSSVFPTIMGHMEGSTEILAAYTIAGNVEKICMVVSFGLAATASIIIGREVGAGRSQQVKKTGAALCFMALVCGTGIGALLLLFARFAAPVWVFPLFKLSARSAAIAVMMLQVQALMRPLRDFNSVAIVGVLRGGGDVKMATIIDTAPQWLVAIPVAALLGAVLRADIFWVYLAIALESLVKFGFGLRRISSDRWIRDLTRA